MYMSLGNIADRAKIGMLFIDFERPQRLRVRGEAQLIEAGALRKVILVPSMSCN